MKRLRHIESGVVYGWNANMAKLDFLEEFDDGEDLGDAGAARFKAREDIAKKKAAALKAKLSKSPMKPVEEKKPVKKAVAKKKATPKKDAKKPAEAKAATTDATPVTAEKLELPNVDDI